MHQWLNARCAKLLEELNNTPFTDDVDEIKLNLIRTAMREASVEMFHRAADSSRKAIEKINKQSVEAAIESVEHDLFQEVMDESEELLKEAEEMATTQPEPEAPASKPTPTMTPELAPVHDTAPVAEEITTPAAPSEEQQAPAAEKPKIQLKSSLISDAPASSDDPAQEDDGEKAKPKIQISSSVIRRSE